MNTKDVMKKAVALAKTFVGDWIARMALALKTVWKEVKTVVANEAGYVQLRGSEKQVAWAESIREDLYKIYKVAKENFIAERIAAGKWNEKKAAPRLMEMEAIEKKVFENTSAKFFIENFGNYTRRQREEHYEEYLEHLAVDLATYAHWYTRPDGGKSNFGATIADMFKKG